MSDALDIYYWDACIFYEYLRDEQQDAYKKQAVEDLLKENAERRNRICTSVMTHTEILPKKIDPEKEQEYWNRFGSTFFYDIEIDRSVINLAREIKDYYYQPAQTAGGGDHKIMSTGDAVHLATAIIHKATVVHTRDQKRRGGNVPLIGLPASSPFGKLCGKYDLTILSPVTDQINLDLQHAKEKPATAE